MSLRRLAVIVRNLPRTSAVERATQGEAAEWSPEAYLLANIADHLAVANRDFAAVHFQGPHKNPDPSYRPEIPGVVREQAEPAKKKFASAAELQRVLSGLQR